MKPKIASFREPLMRLIIANKVSNFNFCVSNSFEEYSTADTRSDKISEKYDDLWSNSNVLETPQKYTETQRMLRVGTKVAIASCPM